MYLGRHRLHRALLFDLLELLILCHFHSRCNSIEFLKTKRCPFKKIQHGDVKHFREALGDYP